MLYKAGAKTIATATAAPLKLDIEFLEFLVFGLGRGEPFPHRRHGHDRFAIGGAD